jgi:two-component system, NarL family, sensor histidine kinase DevS
MQKSLAPGPILVGLLILTVMIALVCVRIAVNQPWLGISLGLIDDEVVIVSAAESGPMAGTRGAELVAIGTPNQAPMALIFDDIVNEPDVLGDAERLRRFFDRQALLFSVLKGEQVTVVTRRDGVEETRVVSPQTKRPLTDLPWQFWTQIMVGVVGLGVGAWVVTLRQQDIAVWMLLLAGAGLAFSAQTAAIYSTRELALDATILAATSRINGIATLTFGIGMVTLFLVYPKRLIQGRLLALPAIIVVGMIGIVSGPNWPSSLPLLQPFVALVMAALLIVIATQVWVNRHDPVARAMIGWLGVSVALGAGSFVLTVIVPILLGLAPIVEQGTAFLFFLIIYAGVALGVSRYRLFDLADWSYGILFYVGGVVLLLACDALLVYGLSLGKLPALSIAFAVVGLIYLPLRNQIADWIRPGRTQPTEVLYQQITKIINIADKQEQLAQIQSLWDGMFRPLSIQMIPAQDAEPHTIEAPALIDGGLALLLPGETDLPMLRLDFAARGGRLFSSRDLRHATTISVLLNDALARQRTYVEAVNAERTRINRDMHNNISILLLSALHSKDPERKDTLIRQTLTDLRDIVSNPAQAAQSLNNLMADSRAEISEVLEAAGVSLDWSDSGTAEIPIPPQIAMTLKSLLRESISNIVRHARASKVTVRQQFEGGHIVIMIADNGRGFDPARDRMGNGLTNLRQRLKQFDGSISIRSSNSGTVLSARISATPIIARAAE